MKERERPKERKPEGVSNTDRDKACTMIRTKHGKQQCINAGHEGCCIQSEEVV